MSPLQPLLYRDSKGNWRIHLTPYEVTPFNAEKDHRFLQGKQFTQPMKDIGNPDKKLTDDEAIYCYEQAAKYYQPNKKQ